MRQRESTFIAINWVENIKLFEEKNKSILFETKRRKNSNKISYSNTKPANCYYMIIAVGLLVKPTIVNS